MEPAPLRSASSLFLIVGKFPMYPAKNCHFWAFSPRIGSLPIIREIATRRPVFFDFRRFRRPAIDARYSLATGSDC
jgi:hypothetical protein